MKNDLISRREAIDVAFDIFPDDEYFREQFVKSIEALPSVQPEPSQVARDIATIIENEKDMRVVLSQPEPRYDEWCTDCKEYDQKRHCCPRWNKVIRETLKDAQPEIIHCKDCKWYGYYSCKLHGNSWMRDGNGYCDRAERRTDE